MKLQTNGEHVVLTSESKREAIQLTTLWVESNSNFKEAKEEKPVHVGRPVGSKAKTPYLRNCKVVECKEKFKGKAGIVQHMLKAHGITRTGENKGHFVFTGKTYRAPKPAEKGGDGEYHLKTSTMDFPVKYKTSLLTGELEPA